MARFVMLDRTVYGRADERNDCTVVALAVACNISYNEAHQVMQVRAGRKPKKGAFASRAFRRMRNGRWECGCRVFGAELQHTIRPYAMTVGKFLDWHTKGRFIIETKTHAMAVIDGAIYDCWDRKRRESQLVQTILVLKVPRRRNRKAPTELSRPGGNVQMA